MASVAVCFMASVAINYFFIVAPICVRSLFPYAVLCVLSRVGVMSLGEERAG